MLDDGLPQGRLPVEVLDLAHTDVKQLVVNGVQVVDDLDAGSPDRRLVALLSVLRGIAQV